MTNYPIHILVDTYRHGGRLSLIMVFILSATTLVKAIDRTWYQPPPACTDIISPGSTYKESPHYYSTNGVLSVTMVFYT